MEGDGFSRRNLLQLGLGALVFGISSTTPENEAAAELVCRDNYMPDPWGRPIWVSRTCSAYLRNGLYQGTPQQKSQWCWAASIETVLRYHRCEVSQQRIVQETFGSAVDLPGHPMDVLINLNKIRKDDKGDLFRIGASSYDANVMTAAYDLSADKPLIIGTMGHAVVLSGLTYTSNGVQTMINSAQVYDPWPGRGLRQLSFQEWNYIIFAARINVEKINP